MAAKRLATFVHVDGQVFGPDDDVPADVAKQIDNPKAWASPAAEDKPSGKKPAGSSK